MILNSIRQALTRSRVKTVDELYQDRNLYTSKDMFSPPSERRPHVIRFELTQGCDWGKCTYCGGFDGVPFREKSLESYKSHVDKVWEKVGRGSSLAGKLTRMFIVGGNALAVETDKLAEAIDYSYAQFSINTGYDPKRISIYGRIPTIADKGSDDLRHLGNKGLGLVYVGLESGSPDVLSYVRKGCNTRQINKAIDALANSGMDVSVMVMPGLGGKRFYDAHAKKTAEVLRSLRPKFLTFMGVNPCPTSEYAKVMNREMSNGANRPLTNKEMVNQIADILENSFHGYSNTKVGCFPTEIDGVGFNPLPFGSLNLGNEINNETLVSILRNAATAQK